MREIKFRAWNGKMKQMFSPEEMARDQMTILPTGQFVNVSGRSTRLSVIYPFDAMLPLQFTGLKDKNGKEIYEGDIVEMRGQSRYVVKYDVVGTRFGLGYHATDTGSVIAINPSKDAVIGSIYENPELLNA